MNHASLIMGIGSLIAGAKAVKDAFDHQPSLGDAMPRVGKKSKYKARTYNVGSIDSRIKHILALIDKGRRDPNVRAFAAKAVSKKCGDKFCIQERDYWGEVKAVFDAIRKNVRYVRDGHRIDTFQAAKRTLEFGAGDCFPEGTLFLTRDSFVAVEHLEIGDEIHDGKSWVKVLKTWDRGNKPILKMTLNNGCVLRLSDTHKTLRVPRAEYAPGRYEEAEEVRAIDLRVGDELLQPHSFEAAGQEELDEDEAFMIGAYLAEGCRTRSYGGGEYNRISIAGIPNAKMIRERVIEILTKRSIVFSETPRDVRFHADAFPALRRLGRVAVQKQLPTFSYGPKTVATILRAMEMGDAGIATNGTNTVYSTISSTLALQYRVLQRFMGRSVSHKIVSDHGGLGKNPIHRLTVRSEDQRKPWAKIKSIELEEVEGQCFDIMTESGRVYLPESDVVSRQCDDYTITMGSALLSIGFPVRLRVIRTTGSKDWNHIFLLVGLPPRSPSKWVALDASVDKPAGWHPPQSMVTKVRDFDVR